MDNICQSEGCIFPHSHSAEFKEVPLLCGRWENVSGQVCALWTISTAPLIFTQIMNVVAAYGHVKGIRVHMYLDDWLIRALVRAELLKHTLWLQDLCLSLGLIVNLPKSRLVPLKDFIFLGIHFQTVSFTCSPLEGRWRRQVRLIRQFIKDPAPSAHQ